MFPFADTSNLSPTQVGLITEAMLQIARVDEAGNAEEVALIRSFYEGATGQSARSDFRELQSAAGAPAAFSPDMLPEAAQQDLMIGLCLMVAYADGRFSAAERAAVQALSQQIGMAEARFDALLEQVRDHLLGQLAMLPDAASVARVAGEL